MTVTILRKSRRKVDVALVRARARRLLEILKLPRNTELSIVLDTDETLRRLHRRLFGLNTRTNVISFGQGNERPAKMRRRASAGPREMPIPFGDVVISVDRAKAEAASAGMTLERRLTELLVHGVLHMMGHEHERGGREAERMRREEARLLCLLIPGAGV